MGKFDINAQSTNESNLTLYDLCKDISDDINAPYSLSEIEFKLKNSQGSGLINKLKKHLNFDIEKMAEVSTAESFDALKLLKELFYIEKDGSPKYKKTVPDSESRIRIIDILAKPRLSNVTSYYSDNSQYGEIIEKLFNDIKSNVPDADERITKIEKIDAYWQKFAQVQFYYVFSDMALADMDNSLKELQRIKKTLERIFDNLDFNERNLHMSTEGVMNTFFNILLTHNKLCYENDRIKSSNYYINNDLHPDKKYTELFKKHEDIPLEIAKVKKLKNVIFGSSKSKVLTGILDHISYTDVLYLISYGEVIPQEDYKHYQYAFEHFSSVLNWLMKEKDEADFSNNVPLVLFISVIQEIVYVKKNSDKFVIQNDFYGYKSNGTSLLSSLKKNEDDVDAVLVDTWIRRTETRFSINYGAHDLIVEKNKAELLMFKIKKFLYEYRNLNELEQANYYISHIIYIAHSDHLSATYPESIFNDWLRLYLKRYKIIIEQCVLPDDPQNIYDMFIELSIQDPVANTYINELAEQVADTIAKKRTPETITHTFTIYIYDGSYRKCYLDFKCDIAEKKFFYKKFGFIYSYDEKKIISKLGLANLIL